MGAQESLRALFEPRSVAVIGASRVPGKVGHEILRNLVNFKGAVYAVNPEAKDILGVKCYPDLSSIPGEVDLAVVAVPAEKVLQVAEEAGKRGVKCLIVVSSGFREVGSEGARRELELVSIAQRYGMRVLGPNCLGVYVPKRGLNTLFMPVERQEAPSHGGIAFVSQSGALGSLILGWLAVRGVGLSVFVNYGNGADINECDILEYVAQDYDTEAVTMYIEGVTDGRRFMKVLKSITVLKPVVVLKAGRSQSGVRAAASHTGSLAGSDSVYEAALRQAGAVRAYEIQELFEVALALKLQPPIVGNRVAVVTTTGGGGILISDALEEEGLRVPRLSDRTVRELRKILLPYAAPQNPVDVTGAGNDDNLAGALEVLIKSDDVDAVVVIPYATAPGFSEDVGKVVAKKAVEALREVVNDGGRPKAIVGFTPGGKFMTKVSRDLEALGIPTSTSARIVARMVRALYIYGLWLQRNNVLVEYLGHFLDRHALLRA